VRTLWSITIFISLVVLAGCGSHSHRVESKGDHEHGRGPHKGAVGDFGKNYHLEFTVAHDQQEATVFILGGDAKSPAPIKADKLTLEIADPKFTVELKPSRQDDDPPGTSSRFVGKHEKFGKEQEFAGKVTGVVDGQTISGDFQEEPDKK
jgi:hypothetical protein